jgi:RHS repeat-associated protein
MLNSTKTYRYSTTGQRTVKQNSINDIEYYLDDVILDADGKVKSYQTSEGYAVPYEDNGTTTVSYYYNVTDWLGTTRGVLDENGNTLNAADHYPYGLRMSGRAFISDVEGNRYQFTGHEHDGETGYDYHGARYYNRELGRYMSTDPLMAEFTAWSPYNYVMGNPISLIDPDGKAPQDWRDKNGNLISTNQLKDVKVYIFYNPDGDGFSDQTMKQYEQYEQEYGKGSVALSNVMTESEFAQDWGDMAGSPHQVVVNHHGSNQALHLNVDPDGDPETKDGQYIVSTNNGKTNGSKTPGTKISDLPTPTADLSKTVMRLNTCNSNNPTSSQMTSGTTLAKGFSNTSMGTVRGSNKKINFDNSGNATPQWYYGGVWQFFQNGKQVENPATKDFYNSNNNPGLKKPWEM